MGGGLLTAIDEDWSPMLISSGNDDTEILVVQVQVEKEKIRILMLMAPRRLKIKNKLPLFGKNLIKRSSEQKMKLAGFL